MIVNSFRLVSWNIEGRVSANRQQAEVLKDRRVDIVALQEVRVNALKNFQKMFPKFDLPYMKESVHLADEHGRRYGELIASRWPLRRIPAILPETLFPERVLSVVVDSPWGKIELHTAHIVPGSSNGWKKIEMFEAIEGHLARQSNRPRILCGDFNSPQLEMTDGQIVTWGQRVRKDNIIVVKRGRKRWDAGERSVLEGLAKYDLPDVFRSLYGYEVEAFSWFSKNKGKVTQRRFDHIFASSALNAVKCQYLVEVVEQRLSDHAAVEAVFEANV